MCSLRVSGLTACHDMLFASLHNATYTYTTLVGKCILCVLVAIYMIVYCIRHNYNNVDRVIILCFNKLQQHILGRYRAILIKPNEYKYEHTYIAHN